MRDAASFCPGVARLVSELALEAAAADLLAAGLVVTVVSGTTALEATRHLVLVRIRVRAGRVEVPLLSLALVLLGRRGLLASGGPLAARTRGSLLRLGVSAIRPGTRDFRLTADLAGLPPARVVALPPAFSCHQKHTAIAITAIATMATITPVLMVGLLPDCSLGPRLTRMGPRLSSYFSAGSSSFSSRFRTLPVALRGSSSRKTTSRGTL